MKKMILMIPVLGIAMLCGLSSCKNNDGSNNAAANSATASADTKAIVDDEGAARYHHYVNEKYGYNVLVPIQMTCTDEAPMAEGANYAIEDGEGMNMLSVIASDNYGGSAFTPDDIKSEMDDRAAELGEEPGTKVTMTETADGWTITVEGGELFHQVYLAKYKAGRRYELTYIYDEAHAPQLGNSIEQDVLESMNVK